MAREGRRSAPPGLRSKRHESIEVVAGVVSKAGPSVARPGGANVQAVRAGGSRGRGPRAAAGRAVGSRGAGYFRISSTRFCASARIGATGWLVVTTVWSDVTMARLTSMMFFTGSSACAYWSWSRAVIAWGYFPT